MPNQVISDKIRRRHGQPAASRKRSLKMDQFVPPLTTSVPEHGNIMYELEKNGSYEARRSGAFSAIEVQGKLRVPWRVELAKMAGGDQLLLEALTKNYLAKLKILREAKAKRVA
jgi:hypothetical protein